MFAGLFKCISGPFSTVSSVAQDWSKYRTSIPGHMHWVLPCFKDVEIKGCVHIGVQRLGERLGGRKWGQVFDSVHLEFVGY